jgi:hypothetical protein
MLLQLKSALLSLNAAVLVLRRYALAIIMVSVIATLQRLRPAEIKAARMDALDMARALTSVQRVQSQLLTVWRRLISAYASGAANA